MDIRDTVESLALRAVLPSLVVAEALPFITGSRTRLKTCEVGPMQAVGCGISLLGMALVIHGIFFHPYENRPMLRYKLLFSGILLFILGFVCWFLRIY